MNLVRSTIRRQTHSAPGPDGVPYACWQADLEHSTITIWNMSESLTTGLRPPIAFNKSIVITPPKGSLPADAQAVVRKPASTRPLMMEVTGNKLVASAHNSWICPYVQHYAHPAQRGFLTDRLLMDNLLDLDRDMRSCYLGRRLGAFMDKAAFLPCTIIWSGFQSGLLPLG